MSRYEDVDLLDMILDGRDDAIAALDAADRARVDELRAIHGCVVAIGSENAAPIPDDVVRRTIARATEPATRGPAPIPLASRRWGAVAALLLIAVSVWVLFVGGSSRVEADPFFGHLDVYEGDRRILKNVRNSFALGEGMTVDTQLGCVLNLGRGFRIRIGPKTRLRCGRLDSNRIELGLERGLVRVGGTPRDVELVIRVGGATLRSRNAIYALQRLGQPSDYLQVDFGTVALGCANKSAEVTPNDGAFLYEQVCPCPCPEGGEPPSGIAPWIDADEVCVSFPMQRDPETAMRLAREHDVPVLVLRRDGPEHCFDGEFKMFVDQARATCGVVWLVVDPESDGAFLAQYGVADPKTIVVLGARGDERERMTLRGMEGHCARSIVSALRTLKENGAPRK